MGDIRGGKAELRELGRYLESIRKRKYENAQEVGQKLGGHPGFYRLIERGERRPSAATLLRIASILGMTDKEKEHAILLAIAGYLPRPYRDVLFGISEDMSPVDQRGVGQK
jgi:transcriptional regulator with XRE-family HTH domain